MNPVINVYSPTEVKNISTNVAKSVYFLVTEAVWYAVLNEEIMLFKNSYIYSFMISYVIKTHTHTNTHLKALLWRA